MSDLVLCTFQNTALKILEGEQSSGEGPLLTTTRAIATDLDVGNLVSREQSVGNAEPTMTMSQVVALLAAMNPAGAMIQLPPGPASERDLRSMNPLVAQGLSIASGMPFRAASAQNSGSRFESSESSPSTTSSPTVSELAERFFDWNTKNRAIKTAQRYCELVTDFVELHGNRSPASLKGIDISEWASGHESWNSTTRSKAIGYVLRLLNWSAEHGLIEANPVKKVEKPRPKTRQTWITAEQHAAVIDALASPGTQALFELAWETGARPQELFQLEARHYQACSDSSTWVFSPEESKGRSVSRVVYLSPKAKALTEELIKQFPSGPLLRNSRGNRWNNLSTDCVLKRLARAGLPKHDLYEWRHGFAVRHINSGTNSLILATLMGHTSLEMLKRTYGHLMQQRQLLASAVGC